MQESNAVEVAIPDMRESIETLAEAVGNLPVPKVEIEVMHHFGDHTYCRTVLMKAGDIIVGKIHKKEHIAIISAGRATVVSEEFGKQEICAPFIMKSPPGARRALYIIEDMVWTTIHDNPTNTQNLAELEEYLIAKDYEGVKLWHGQQSEQPL